MEKFTNLKNKVFSKVYSKIPSLVDLYAKHADLVVNTTTPFAPLNKPLNKCRVSLVTTGGLHTKDQPPFDMTDKKGDPTYRELSSTTSVEELTITHNYYNHTDALDDPNLVLPLDPLRRLLQQGIIGEIGPRVFSFMGHITDHHLKTLAEETAPEVAAALVADTVDVIFLTPA
jgi:D-proline reductase (dithiol) PrdB